MKLLLSQMNSSRNMSTFITIIFIVLFSSMYQTTSEAITVCKKASQPLIEKPHIVLVHGFMAGGWYWYKVRFYLESLGYNVTCPDLQGSGLDPTDVNNIDTLEQYMEPLNRLFATMPKDQKVVLVSHSAGGVSITKILHDYPEKVLLAIYVCSTMLKFGYTTCEHLQIGSPYFSASKCNASCPKLPDPTCFDKVLSAEKHSVGEGEDDTLFMMAVRPGPYRALVTSKFTEKNNVGGSLSIDNVPRVYVKTRHDTTLLPEQQDAMIKLWPPCEVIEINTNHGAPAEKPDLLATMIVNATAYVSTITN